MLDLVGWAAEIGRGEDLPPANPYPEAIVDDYLGGESSGVSFGYREVRFKVGIKFGTWFVHNASATH